MNKMAYPNRYMAETRTPFFKEVNHAAKHTKKQMWCPYCGEWRRFQAKKTTHMDGTKSIGYKRCTGCSISDQDYWVKHVNKKWEISLKPTGKGKGRK
jgi:Pyruvate/2-oxoacid:ferredoxin oxidoreductase delta subunit